MGLVNLWVVTTLLYPQLADRSTCQTCFTSEYLFSSSDTPLPNSRCHPLVQTILYYKLSSRFPHSSTLGLLHEWSGSQSFLKVTFHFIPTMFRPHALHASPNFCITSCSIHEMTSWRNPILDHTSDFQNSFYIGQLLGSPPPRHIKPLTTTQPISNSAAFDSTRSEKIRPRSSLVCDTIFSNRKSAELAQHFPA